MKYSEQVIEDIREGNDIVDIISNYTSLKQKGSSYFGICPFHNESTPSFSVSPDKQLYHCFGCGASGTVFNFIMDIENYSFVETLEFLAKKINYELPTPKIYNSTEYKNKISIEEKLYKIHKIVARKYYENLLSSNGLIATRYLDSRKVSTNIRKKFGLGYSLNSSNDIYNFLKKNSFSDEDILLSGLVLKNKKGQFYDRFYHRLMFPIIDVRGRIIGFGGRELDSEKSFAKYLNSPETPIFNKSFNLYGLNFAKLNKNKELILVEGYMDVLALYQIGLNNSVACLGTSFNDNNASVLKKYASQVTIIFDNDEAGVNATLKTIPILIKNGIQVKILTLKNAKDPDEFIKKFGHNNFKKALLSSKSHIHFQIEQKLKLYNMENSVDKINFIKDAAKIISTLQSNIDREVFAREISNITNISFENINSEILKFVSFPQKKQPLNYNKPKINCNTKLEEAKTGLIYIIYKDNNVFNKVKNYLSPKEFLDEHYIKLTEIIFEYYNNNTNIYPPEIISKFDDKKVQQKISKIFMPKNDIDDNLNLEKIVNDYFKIIKSNYINFEINKSKDENNLNNLKYLFEQKKLLDELYINLV